MTLLRFTARKEKTKSKAKQNVGQEKFFKYNDIIIDIVNYRFVCYMYI